MYFCVRVEFFESKAKILLIVSLPQEVFISSGATVKTSLVFLKKFTDAEASEYETISENTKAEAEVKYADELEAINKQLALKGKEAPSKEVKKELNDKKKEIEEKITSKTKAIIKDRFNYQIPIADIKKAGISSTGGKEDNELPKLLEEFKAYRNTKALW